MKFPNLAAKHPGDDDLVMLDPLQPFRCKCGFERNLYNIMPALIATIEAKGQAGLGQMGYITGAPCGSRFLVTYQDPPEQ